MVHFQIGESVLVWILCSTVKSLSDLERLSTNGQLDVILIDLFNSLKVTADNMKVEVSDLQDELEGIKKWFWSTYEGIFEMISFFSTINVKQFYVSSVQFDSKKTKYGRPLAQF